ncbi:hypothetical protein QAD02_024388 [Eretmocerus hayati]|uniref:Uncharacterized protein n=1 Tax=Eretmocerus hayati TaxID=131215 RepID=A0ACC2PZM4_9HYME|nr:hypothetical protein QAD02_024388 [Eretmocerus hayati]
MGDGSKSTKEDDVSRSNQIANHYRQQIQPGSINGVGDGIRDTRITKTTAQGQQSKLVLYKSCRAATNGEAEHGVLRGGEIALKGRTEAYYPSKRTRHFCGRGRGSVGAGHSRMRELLHKRRRGGG